MGKAAVEPLEIGIEAALAAVGARLLGSRSRGGETGCLREQVIVQTAGSGDRFREHAAIALHFRGRRFLLGLGAMLGFQVERSRGVEWRAGRRQQECAAR